MNRNAITKTLPCLWIVILFSACKAQDHSAETMSDCSSLAKTPVLFVHGSGLSSGSFDILSDTFIRNAYPPAYVLTINMVPNDGDNVSAAESFISPGAKRLLERSRRLFGRSNCNGNPPDRIDIVAHSMGAFSARWYARFVAPETVQTIVTIAGANHGTDALCRRPGSGDQQMCPAYDYGSSGNRNVQAKLNGTADAPLDETPWGAGRDSAAIASLPPDETRRIRYLTIRIEPDEWIIPSESALLDGADKWSFDNLERYRLRETSPGNLLFYGTSTHDGLLANSELIQFLVIVLALPWPDAM